MFPDPDVLLYHGVAQLYLLLHSLHLSGVLLLLLYQGIPGQDALLDVIVAFLLGHLSFLGVAVALGSVDVVEDDLSLRVGQSFLNRRRE